MTARAAAKLVGRGHRHPPLPRRTRPRPVSAAAARSPARRAAGRRPRGATRRIDCHSVHQAQRRVQQQQLPQRVAELGEARAEGRQVRLAVEAMDRRPGPAAGRPTSAARCRPRGRRTTPGHAAAAWDCSRRAIMETIPPHMPVRSTIPASTSRRIYLISGRRTRKVEPDLSYPAPEGSWRRSTSWAVRRTLEHPQEHDMTQYMISVIHAEATPVLRGRHPGGLRQGRGLQQGAPGERQLGVRRRPGAAVGRDRRGRATG